MPRREVRDLRPRQEERGSAALSVAVLGVVIVLLPMALIQAALYGNARQIAAAAARHGVEAARVTDGSTSVGETTAAQYADQAGGLEQPSVNVTGGEDEVTVTVSGEVTSLLPGVTLTVTATRTSPSERFEP